MLFRPHILEGIQRGEITLAFRRWLRPAVRPGGTLKTGMGVVRFGAVDKVDATALTEAAARAAGYDSAGVLRAELDQRDEGDLYRIEVTYAGPDPRIALRADTALTPETLADLHRKLARLDAASPTGPWTTRVLRLIADNPAVRAATLAQRFGQDRDRFKLDVRKLKNLGLTESLEIGYRLSPRGQHLLATLENPPPPPRAPAP